MWYGDTGNGREASKVIPHEQYKDGEVKFDIAVIWFKRPLEFDFDVNEVALLQNRLMFQKSEVNAKLSSRENPWKETKRLVSWVFELTTALTRRSI